MSSGFCAQKSLRLSTQHQGLILDYSASVWSPHTQSNIKQIEAVQNRAARFVFGEYRHRSSVPQMKKELELKGLKIRQISLDLHIPNSHLRSPSHHSHNIHVSGRAEHTLHISFIPISTRKDCLKHSFLPKTVIDWNSLPANINISYKDQFKSHVYKYLTPPFLHYCAPPPLLGLSLLLGASNREEEEEIYFIYFFAGIFVTYL